MPLRIPIPGAWLLVLVTCAGEVGPPPPTPGQPFADDRLGLSLEIPPGWEHTSNAGRHLFSGPEGSDAYYTTVTIQQLGADRPLDSALEAAYAPLADLRRFAWSHREPSTLAGHPALRYVLRFELHEKVRDKSGVLLHTGRHIVDIAYGAPEDLYPIGLPAYQRILASVALY